MNFKQVLHKFKRLFTISLSLAIMLTVLPVNVKHVNAAAKYVTFTVTDFKNQNSNTNLVNKTFTKTENGVTLSIKFTVTGGGEITRSGTDYFKFRHRIGAASFSYKITTNLTNVCKGYIYTTGDFELQFPMNEDFRNFFKIVNGKTYTYDDDTYAFKSMKIYLHDLVKVNAKAPDCINDGWNEYWECSSCKKVFDNSSGTGTAYANANTWKASTAGKINKLEHNFNSETATSTYLKSVATCTSPAEYYYKCATCDAKGTTTYTSGTALGHNYRETWTYDETDHWYQCERCLDKKDEAEHTGGTATCIQLAICETCNKEYGDFAEHTLQHKNAQAANCDQEGYEEYWECSICHNVYANDQATGTAYTETSWKDGDGKLEKNNDHDWSYTVNGNTITATCSRNEEEHTASISISTTDAEYSRSAYTGVDETAWTNSSFELTIPEVNYIGRDTTTYESTTAPTNAGKYIAQITVGEDTNAVTASSNFEITKKEVELNWHNTTVTYNGTAQAPTSIVINKANEADEVNVNVTFDGGHTNANANGESYTAIASSLSGTAAGNYKLPTTLPTHPFVIEPKAISLTSIIASYTKSNPLTYNNSPFTQVITITDGSNSLTQNTDFELEGDITKTVPGLYDTIVKGKGNYTGQTTIEWEIIAAPIHEANIDVSPYNNEYDGQYHSITVSPKEDLDGATVTYSETEDGEYTQTNPSYKNAGEYTVYYKVEKEHHVPLTGFSTVTIAHKEVTIGWSNTVLTYNGTAQKPTATVTNKVSGDVVNVTVTGEETNAGTYTAIASELYGDNSDNYVLNYKLPINKPSTTYTINKAKVDAPLADQTVFTYDGSIKTYTLATNELYTISNNTRTNAGTQTVTVELNNKDNYEWNNVSGSDDQKVADREYTFTINKATVTIPTADDTTYTYTGQPQTYGLSETDDYTVTNLTHTNAGTYEVDVILKDHNNYMWSDNTIANKKYDFIINKAEVIAPQANTNVFTYTGLPLTYSLTVNDELYTILNNTKTNAGTYKVDVVLKDNNNYKWSDTDNDFKEYTFFINKKSVTIPTADQTVFTYDKTEKVYTLQTSNLYDILNNKHYNAGTYTVSVVLKDKENYEWDDQQATTAEQKIANKEYTFIINKAKVDIPEADPIQTTPGFTFNRTIQTYTIEPSDLYSVSNNRQTNAGTYTVTVTLIDKDNYEWKDIEETDKTADQEYIFTINPLDISDTATIALESEYYEFTGLEKTAKVSLITDGVLAIYEDIDYELSGNKQTTPGTYTLTASFIGNYTGSKSINWLIVEDIQHTQNVELPQDEDYVGELELVVTGDEDVPEIDLSNPIHLLDEEDLDKLKEGHREIPDGQDSTYYYVINLILSLNEKTIETIDPISLQAIIDVADSPTGSHYYDISVTKVLKKVEITKSTTPDEDPIETVIDTTITLITNTNDPIEITIHVPNEIPELKGGYRRTYSVIRSHKIADTVEGPIYEANVLDTEYTAPNDENPTGTITFTSNKFSDYVLTYKDIYIYIPPKTGVE